MIVDMSDKNMEQEQNKGALGEIGETLKNLVRTHKCFMGIIEQTRKMLNMEFADIESQKTMYEATIKAFYQQDSSFTNAIETLGDELIKSDKKQQR